MSLRKMEQEYQRLDRESRLSGAVDGGLAWGFVEELMAELRLTVAKLERSRLEARQRELGLVGRTDECDPSQ